MKSVVVAVMAVIVGYVVWTAIWLSGAIGLQSVMPESLPADPKAHITDTGALLAVLGLSIVCSLVAGYLAKVLAPSSPSAPSSNRPVAVMSALLLATGIAVEVDSWERMPVWYHLTFLVLLVPMCFGGARFAARD